MARGVTPKLVLLFVVSGVYLYLIYRSLKPTATMAVQDEKGIAHDKSLSLDRLLQQQHGQQQKPQQQQQQQQQQPQQQLQQQQQQQQPKQQSQHQANSSRHVIISGREVTLHQNLRVVGSVPPSNTAPMDPKLCLPLPQAPKSMIICIHDPKDDQWVSGAIATHQVWEADLVDHMKTVLQAEPNMQLVDLGSNIGIYTLMAAALGRYVLAVDLLDKNILLLQNSLQRSNVSDLVTLVQNAVYKDHDSVLGFKTYKGNVGGTYVDENATDTKDVLPVCLNDLLPLVRTKSVFLKMDIENSEHHALACSQDFFTNLDVKIIQMEWSHKSQEATNQIKDFISRYGYAAKRLQGVELVPYTVEYFARTGDVFFVKESSENPDSLRR